MSDAHADDIRKHVKTYMMVFGTLMVLTVVTVFEILAGLLSGLGALAILFWGGLTFAHAGAVLASVTLLMLFFGQRVAKDYAGAAVLVPYFLLSLLAIHVLQ